MYNVCTLCMCVCLYIVLLVTGSCADMQTGQLSDSPSKESLEICPKSVNAAVCLSVLCCTWLLSRSYSLTLSLPLSPVQGHVCKHSCAPYALSWTSSSIMAAGCDRRVKIYSHAGK